MHDKIKSVSLRRLLMIREVADESKYGDECSPTFLKTNYTADTFYRHQKYFWSSQWLNNLGKIDDSSGWIFFKRMTGILLGFSAFGDSGYKPCHDRDITTFVIHEEEGSCMGKDPSHLIQIDVMFIAKRSAWFDNLRDIYNRKQWSFSSFGITGLSPISATNKFLSFNLKKHFW